MKLLVTRHLASDGQLVDAPPQHLRGIFPHASVAPGRPETPLSESTILTLGRNEPRIGSELAREIESADRVDALVSFVTKGGVRQLRDAIDRLCRRYRPGGAPVLRLVTTTYIGATEASAVATGSPYDVNSEIDRRMGACSPSDFRTQWPATGLWC